MPQLEIKPTLTHLIKYDDWDAFVSKRFPACTYDSIASEEEVLNGFTWTHEVSVAMNEDRLKAIEAYLFEGEDLFMVGTKDILNYLAYKGEIPQGHYSIRVYW